jgi:hypothetical protein
MAGLSYNYAQCYTLFYVLLTVHLDILCNENQIPLKKGHPITGQQGSRRGVEA